MVAVLREVLARALIVPGEMISQGIVVGKIGIVEQPWPGRL